MSEVNDIVEVVISRETTSVARASFGVPCIITEFADNRFSGTGTASYGRAMEFASLKEVTAFGFLSTSEEYKMAKSIFAQNPKVKKIVIGRKDSGDAGWPEAIAAVQAVNDSWYALVALADGTFATDMTAIAGYIETQKKIFFVQTTEVDTYNPALTSDLASTLKASALDRTATVYHTLAKADEYLNAGWLGEGLPFDPGSSTYAYKTVAGVTADPLTTTQRNAIQAKNCNTYCERGGVNVTQKGVMASGEFIDIIIGLDWLESRLMETVYGALVNERKISYDDGGIQSIAGLVQSVLEEAGRAGVLQIDTISVTYPRYSEVPQADRLARHLPDIKFSALLQGAIHTVSIEGTVSV